MKTCLLLLLLFVAFQAMDLDDPEHPRIDKSSDEFLRGTPGAVEFLSKSDFEEGLEKPTLAASSEQDFQRAIGEIKTTSTVSDLGVGDPNISYDVILQPGHYQRSSGRTGTEGKYISEQALVAYITNVIATKLHSTGENVLVVSADNYLRPQRVGGSFSGLHGKVFVAIHADGSQPSCKTGPSLGYQKPATVIAMNFIALGLADALGYDYASFRSNFTANEAEYYMFSQLQANRLSGLLEIGELTCEKSEREMILSSHAIGTNVARAIDFILRTPDSQASNLKPSPASQPVH